MPDTLKEGAFVRLRPDQLQLHPACDGVPEMSPAEWAEFLADVGRRGIIEPIAVTPNPGKRGLFREANDDVGYFVIDGRHRFRAWKLTEGAAIDCRVVEIAEENIESYVIGAALHRRHLKDSQRAILAEKYRAKLAKKSVDKKTEKMRAAKQNGGSLADGVSAKEKPKQDNDLDSADATKCKTGAENGNGAAAKQSDSGKPPVGASTPHHGPGHAPARPDENAKTRNRDAEPTAQAAKTFGVSERQMRSAKIVIENGCAELVNAVEQGLVDLAGAKRLAALPISKQRSIVAGGAASIKSALRQPELQRPAPTDATRAASSQEALPGETLTAQVARLRREEEARENAAPPAKQAGLSPTQHDLLRMGATKLLHDLRAWNIAAEQAVEHKYLEFAMRKWTPERKAEMAEECERLSEQMAYFHGKLTLNVKKEDE